MARLSRLEIAKKDVLSHFESMEVRQIYSIRDIGQILSENRDFWRLAQRTTVSEFIDFLIKNGKLRAHRLKADHYDQEHLRYAWGSISFPKLALSIKVNSYLCHGSAVFIHNLNDLVPRVWYVNQEQSVKHKSTSDIQQSNLNRAFSSKQRISNLSISDSQGNKALIVSGKNTKCLGVDTFLSPGGEKVRTTDLERTLIDIVVRPVYAGGISEVLEAYIQAKDMVSVNTMRSYLKKLDYSYPYHQSIGFLMEKAGYKKNRFSMMKDMGLNYDFYLAYGMKDPIYNKEWRLHIPRNL